MKRRIPIICITTVAVASVGLAIALIPQGCTQSTYAAQSPQQNKIAYGIGFYLGEEVRSGLDADEVQADLDLLIRGFENGLKQQEPEFDRVEVNALLQALHQLMQDRMVERLLEGEPEFKTLHDDNLAASQAFMVGYSKRQGVKSLDNGVCYEIIELSDGRLPTINDTIIVTYRVMHMNGSEFDTGNEKEMVVANLMEGGQSIITQMPVGSRWNIAIPPELAFGAFGDPPTIGPNEAILIDVKLLGVKGKSP